MKTNMQINRRFQGQFAAALLLAVISSQPTTAHAAGSPVPTVATQIQMESRTPIHSAPFTIKVPGSYYLATNLTVSGAVPSNGITIATNNVTLDLNGFTISSVAAASTTVGGILLNSGMNNITIRNGFIRGGVWHNGVGGYSGNGFGYGIYYPSGLYSGNYPTNVVVSKVSVAGVLDAGILLGFFNGTVVEDCTVTTAGYAGIFANTVKGSVATDCGMIGIFGVQAVDCTGISVGGSGIIAGNAQNCFGETFSTSPDSAGLRATTAQNCFGQSTNSIGLRADTALNCEGSSTSGPGLDADIALNCDGYSTSGTGLDAFMANSCFGVSDSGTGLTCTYGNFSFGSPLVVVTGQKWNMP